MSIRSSGKYVILEWGNSCDIANILYQKDFKNRLYLDVDVANPQYRLETNAETDGDGDPHVTWQKWAKVYSFEAIFPEYALDALTMIPMHDDIYIWLKNGDGGKIREIVISEPDWELSCYAQVSIEFVFETYIKTACCENVTAAAIECLQATLPQFVERIEVGGAKWATPLTYYSVGQWVLGFHPDDGDWEVLGQVRNDNVVEPHFEYNDQSGEIPEFIANNANDGDDYYPHSFQQMEYLNWPKRDFPQTAIWARWINFVEITLYTEVGGTVGLKGIALPGSQIRVFYDSGGGDVEFNDSPISAETWEGAGITQAGFGAGSYTFKAQCYTAQCEYGEDTQVETIT